MNIDRSVHTRRSQKLSDDSNEESYLIEQRLRNFLTNEEGQNRIPNLFNNVQEVPKLRRSVVARAVRNMCCSTPMPTKKNIDYFCEDNISPINSVSDNETCKELQENKKEGEEEKKLQVVLNRVPPSIVILDSEDEEEVQNIEEVDGNKINRITETENCCNVTEGRKKYTKKTEDSELQQNLHNGSGRNVTLRNKSNNRTPSAKVNTSKVINQQSNRTLSKQINSLIIEPDKSLKQNKTNNISDAVQLPTLHEQENTISNQVNYTENINNQNVPKMTLRSKNSISLINQNSNKTPSNQINSLTNEPVDKNLNHNETDKISDAVQQPTLYEQENTISNHVIHTENTNNQNISKMTLRSKNSYSFRKDYNMSNVINQNSNRTLSNQIDSLINQPIDKNLSHNKTLKSKQKISEAIHQTPNPYQPENTIFNVETTNNQKTSDMILRSQNINSTKKENEFTKLTSPRITRPRDIENSKENLSNINKYKSRKETPEKTDTKNEDATSSNVQLQKRISARKLSFAAKNKDNCESKDNTSVIDKEKNLPVSVKGSAATLSKIPVPRSRSKSKEKMGETNSKHPVQIDMNSLEARRCNEHITNEKSPYLQKNSPPKRPPRKRKSRNRNLTKMKNILITDTVRKDSATNTECAEENDVAKLKDPSNFRIVIGNEGRNDPEKNKTICQNEENNCGSILQSTLETTLTNERGTSPMIFNTINKLDLNEKRDILPTLDKSKAEKLDQLVFKIKMLNKEVQTSAKGADSEGKNRKTSKRLNKLSKKALNFEGNNSTKCSSDSEIIKETEKEQNPYLLYQTLEEEFSLNFSSSDDEMFEDTLCYNHENRPWRIDDDLQIFSRRSSVKLNFIKSAQEIESNSLRNQEYLSNTPSHSTNIGCTKKNELQKYSRTTIYNNRKSVKLKPSDTDKIITPSEKICVSNTESSNKKKLNPKVKALVTVETQTTNKDSNRPELSFRNIIKTVEETETHEKVNGENNDTNVRNRKRKTNDEIVDRKTEEDQLIKNHRSDNEEPVSLERHCLPVADSISVIKETTKKSSTKPRLSRSTNKKVNNANKNNLMKSVDNLTENVYQDDDGYQGEDVLAVPLENSRPHLRDSVSINKNGENNGSENQNKNEVNNEIIKGQISSSKLNHTKLDVELNDTGSAHGGNTSVIATKKIKKNVFNQAEDNVGNQSSHLKVHTPSNKKNRLVLGKHPSANKPAKEKKSKRKKVITGNNDDVSSITTHSQQETGIRRSARDRKVPPRRCYGAVTTYSEREFHVFDALSQCIGTDRLKPRTKNNKTARNDTKTEEPSVKRSKIGKKGKNGENLSKMTNRSGRKKTQSKNEESNSDRLPDINLNKVETTANVFCEGSTTTSSWENNLRSSTKINSNQDSTTYQTATSRNGTNENPMRPSLIINSSVHRQNTNINSHIEANTDTNVNGTDNNVEENLNSQPNEDFLYPSRVSSSRNKSSDEHPRQSTVTFEDSTTLKGRTLGGRITKSNKKKNIRTKISNVLSRSINTSKEQEILNERDMNMMSSSAASNDVQDIVSRRTSILQSRPLSDEYITLFSDVNLVSMRYVDIIPKFKLVRDNLLLAESLTNVRDGGTMGYLKLPPAGQKSLHIARKFSLFYFVMEGEGILQVHNKTSTINKLSTFIVPVGIEYSIVNRSMVDELVLGFVKVPNKEET